MALVLPPNEVFSVPPTPLPQTQGGYGTFGWVKDVCPESGGLFAYYKNEPYPRKGHVYPEAVEANNVMKRTTAMLLLSLASSEAALPLLGFVLTPWKRKIKWLEKILFNYVRLGDYINRQHYLKRKFYNQFSKELWNSTYVFLRNLGISAPVAYGCGRVVAHMLELEDAWRARVQDIFSEVDEDTLLGNPRREINRLTQIYIAREKEGLHDRFLALPKLLSIALLFPKIKRIFINTIKATKFENLRYDEIDRYYVLNRNGYDFLGRNIEDRFAEFKKLHNEFVFNKIKEQITDPAALERITQQLTNLGIT